MDNSKPKFVKDKRSEDEQFEDHRKNSAAIRGKCLRCGEFYKTSMKKHDIVCSNPMADLASISEAIENFAAQKRN